jgi:hypothetical protein
MKKLCVSLAFFVVLGFAANGQLMAFNIDKQENHTFEVPSGAVVHGSENHSYFIDLGKISFLLKDLKLVDAKGNVVFSDELSSIPVDAIYEMSTDELAPGKYKLFLDAFVRTTEIEIQVP